MFPDEQVAADRRIRRGIGDRRRRLGGSEVLVDGTPVRDWKFRGGGSDGVSARTLAASLWRLSASRTVNDGGSVRRRCGAFGWRNFELCASLTNAKFETEGITKWDFCCSKSIDLSLKKNREFATVGSAGQTTALRKPRKCIKTEHQKVMCSIVKNLADDIKREREKCIRMDIANCKLVRDIAKTKLSTRTLMWRLEREKKTRKLLESVCNELAKVVEGGKAEIAELRNQHARVEEEVEEEKRVMQIAEICQEERAQTKIVDVKLMLEDKYAEMSSLIAGAKAFMKLNNSTAKNVTSRGKDSKHAVDPQISDACRESIHSNGLTVNGNAISDRNGKQTGIRDETCMSNCDTALGNGAVNSEALVEHRRNPHVIRAMKGHIVWPRGIQRHGSAAAAKHLEAKLESQRMLMRNVLKQRC